MREEVPGNDPSRDKVVIPCVHHKTGTAGLAFLVITEEIDNIIQCYYDKILQTIVPVAGCEEYLFLTRRGWQYTQVHWHIKDSLGVTSITPPQPKLYRIVVSTEARQHLDEVKRHNTVKHPSHCGQTSEKFYEYMNSYYATEAHDNISVLSALRRWTQHETK